MCIDWVQQEEIAMNNYPNIDVIALYSRSVPDLQPDWKGTEARHIRRVRTSHTRRDGGVIKSFYTVETEQGEILDLEYERDELLWHIADQERGDRWVIDHMLCHIKKETQLPSFDHRLVPYRFYLRRDEPARATVPALIERMQPWRFLKQRQSLQVTQIRCRHNENVKVTDHLHYVVGTDLKRYFNLVYVRKWAVWKFVQEIDEELFLNS